MSKKTVQSLRYISEKSPGFAGNAATLIGLLHTLSDGVSKWQSFLCRAGKSD